MKEFQKGLVGKTINSVEIAASSLVRVCTEANVANDIASAFSVCQDSCNTQTFTCSGNDWLVGSCRDGVEMTVGQKSTTFSDGVGINIGQKYITCSCNTGDIKIRPCINTDAWGGPSGGCRQDTTTLRISVTEGNLN